MVERIKPLFGGAPTIFHVRLPATLPSPSPFDAPVTECISQYFELSWDTSRTDANLIKFVEEMANVPNKSQGIVAGWGVEEQKHENLSAKEGEKGPAKFLGAFIGWPNLEAHQELRNHEKFAEVVKYLRDGPKAVAMYHVALKKF